MASKRKPGPAHEESVLAQPVRELAKGRLAQLPAGYVTLLDDLKTRIRATQVKASLSVNRELIGLYWHIGKAIVERQEAEGWGKSVVERLADDLQNEFPGIGGFSVANIWRMRAFYLAWAAPELAQAVREMDATILPQPVSEIPWGHNIALLQKLKDPATRLWYAQQTIANGWSRVMLIHWIESDLYSRQGKAVTNFPAALPAPQSDLAQQIIKDPYNFDFLTLAADARERELERGLLDHIRKFLLELGAGFAFVGQQYHLEVDGQDFFIDLLFYHLELRCYVVIDLKVEPFKPEFAGKMNFYLSAVDDLLRHGDDKPSIGLILCKTRSKVIAEYALRHLSKPVGVAQYVTKLVEKLPADLKKSLPSPKELEAELKKTKPPEQQQQQTNAELVFLFDSTVQPFKEFDIQEATKLLEKLQASGTTCELIDTKNLAPAELDRWREHAWIIAVYSKVEVRQPFGSRKQGGLPNLGKQVPALFVFEADKARPVAVYPHRKRGKEFPILAYLRSRVGT